jgi:putative transposase
VQRWRRKPSDERRGPIDHARKLTLKEQDKVLQVACLEKYYDDAPAQIVAKLADDGIYLASESTFYRLLRKENLLGHRSRAKCPEKRERVETIATAPNTVWCWDITNLRTRSVGEFYKLYMFEDLYSRKIVGWEVLEKESDQSASFVLEKSLQLENISGNDLRLHSDNGNPMRGINMLTKVLSLGIRPSFSRPSVSNDNPYIESLFKTMKYTPSYPTKPFKSLLQANMWVEKFVSWYNNRLHSKLSYITPNQRHQKIDQPILENRRRVYALAKKANPLRWTKHQRSWSQPVLATLNPLGTRMVS